MASNNNKFDKRKQNHPFKETMDKLLEESGEKPADLYKSIGVTQQAFSRWTNNGFPTVENLLKIADHFNCSLNYLVGLSKVKSPDASLQKICDYTGLSEKAVNYLHEMTLSPVREYKRPLHLLNTVLSDPGITPNEKTRIIKASNDKLPDGISAEDCVIRTVDFPVSLFSLVDQYITSGNVVRILDRYDSKSRDIISPEDYHRKKDDEEWLMKTVSFNSSEDMTETYSAGELYKELIMLRIREALEYYRKEQSNGIDKT